MMMFVVGVGEVAFELGDNINVVVLCCASGNDILTFTMRIGLAKTTGLPRHQMCDGGR